MPSRAAALDLDRLGRSLALPRFLTSTPRELAEPVLVDLFHADIFTAVHDFC